MYFSSDPFTALHLAGVVEEKPANQVRGVGRYFCSELEDKPWYYDKEFWSGYLDRLVASRFNRFTMAFGLEYDFPRGVTDDYFHFVYPYLVDVPGYQVRIVQLAAPDGTRLTTPAPLSQTERRRNFEMLGFIAAETALAASTFNWASGRMPTNGQTAPMPTIALKGSRLTTMLDTAGTPSRSF